MHIYITHIHRERTERDTERDSSSCEWVLMDCRTLMKWLFMTPPLSWHPSGFTQRLYSLFAGTRQLCSTTTAEAAHLSFNHGSTSGSLYESSRSSWDKGPHQIATCNRNCLSTSVWCTHVVQSLCSWCLVLTKSATNQINRLIWRESPLLYWIGRGTETCELGMQRGCLLVKLLRDMQGLEVASVCSNSWFVAEWRQARHLYGIGLSKSKLGLGWPHNLPDMPERHPRSITYTWISRKDCTTTTMQVHGHKISNSGKLKAQALLKELMLWFWGRTGRAWNVMRWRSWASQMLKSTRAMPTNWRWCDLSYHIAVRVWRSSNGFIATRQGQPTTSWKQVCFHHDQPSGTTAPFHRKQQLVKLELSQGTHRLSPGSTSRQATTISVCSALLVAAHFASHVEHKRYLSHSSSVDTLARQPEEKGWTIRYDVLPQSDIGASTKPCQFRRSRTCAICALLRFSCEILHLSHPVEMSRFGWEPTQTFITGLALLLPHHVRSSPAHLALWKVGAFCGQCWECTFAPVRASQYLASTCRVQSCICMISKDPLPLMLLLVLSWRKVQCSTAALRSSSPGETARFRRSCYILVSSSYSKGNALHQ